GRIRVAASIEDAANVAATTIGSNLIELWNREFVENFLDDGFAGFLFGFGFVGDSDAMAKDVHADGFDVLRSDVAAAFEERVGFGGEGERDRCARRGAELDEFLYLD